MKWIRVYEQGDPDVMRYEDAPLPEPGAGEVRMRVEAAGVNFIDTYQRSGQYKLPLPFTPGREAVGVIDAVGTGVQEFAPGDRVAFAFGMGGYAEYAVVPAAQIIPLPAHIEVTTAAAVLLQGITAHYLSHDTFPIQRGQTALVHAAAGGTGSLLLQMIKMRGGRVIATVGSVEKAQIARSLGADEVILYREQDFETETRRITGGMGVDVVYDSVGKDTFDKSLNCLRPRGMMVLYGQASGAVPPFDPQILNHKGSLYLTRPSIGAYTATRDELLRRAKEVLDWTASGTLKVTIDRVYPLSEAAEAHRALTSRATKGKILLIP